MTRAGWLFAVVAALAVASSAYLYRSNSQLQEELAKLEKAESESTVAEVSETEAPEVGSSGANTARNLLSRLGRPAGVDRPSLPEQKSETRQERRARRQSEIRDFLGRAPGETAEDYIARMKPIVEFGLKVPRQRLADARAEAERLAEVSDEQRAKLDEVFEDVYSEALELTNQAIDSGELSPYERNWSGAAQLVGGLGAVLDGAEQRIGGVLNPDQIRRIRDSGFEWGEYLGANAPWENLNPPPPPPGDDG